MTVGRLDINEGWINNPLRTRNDLLNAAAVLLEPLLAKFTPKKAGILAIQTGAHFDVLAAQLEGFSRVLWAVAAIKAGWETPAPSTEVEHVIAKFVAAFREGVAAGTDPESDEYWGLPDDCDQRLVEMAALGYSLFMCPAVFWDPLPEKVKTNFAAYLNHINNVGIVNNNWLFFRVLVNVGLRTVGASYDQKAADAALDSIDKFYLSDGWYFDGSQTQLDYYVPFAFHFYGLVYSVHATWDKERGDKFKERAAKYADDFYTYFSPSGAGIPFGRSLTYRFAHSSFWAAMAYAGVEGSALTESGTPVVSTPVIKHLLLQNLRFWARQPFLLDDGSFSIGYAYPNLFMSEEYNSANSPYWAMKSVIALAIPSTSEFWSVKEAENVHKPFTKLLTHASQLVVNDAWGHTYALSCGQQADWFRHVKAKYGKFVYSSTFAFSVPGADNGLGHAAGDCALVITNDNEVYVPHGHPVAHGFTKLLGRDVLWGKYKAVLNNTVGVSTWLVPPQDKFSPWHTRIHKIENTGDVTAQVVDGGFSVSSQTEQQRPIRESQEITTAPFKTSGKNFALINSPTSGISGLATTDAYVVSGKAQVTDPNSNLMFPRAIMPTLRYTIPPKSTVWLTINVFAVPSTADVAKDSSWVKMWNSVPDAGPFLNLVQ